MNRKRDLYLIAEAYNKTIPLKISGKDFKKVIPKEYKHATYFAWGSKINLQKTRNVFDVVSDGAWGIDNGRRLTPEQMREATSPKGLETYLAALPFHLKPYIQEGPGFFSKEDNTKLYVYTGSNKKLIKAIHEDFDMKNNPTTLQVPGLFTKVVLWPNTTYKDYTSKDTTDEFGNLMDEL